MLCVESKNLKTKKALENLRSLRKKIKSGEGGGWSVALATPSKPALGKPGFKPWEKDSSTEDEVWLIVFICFLLLLKSSSRFINCNTLSPQQWLYHIHKNFRDWPRTCLAENEIRPLFSMVELGAFKQKTVEERIVLCRLSGKILFSSIEIFDFILYVC